MLFHIDSKGYPRFHVQPHRNKRVHRVIAERMLGRQLTKDEVVHHKDGNKRNFRRSNLSVMTGREHNALTAKQYWFLKQKEAKEAAAWQSYHGR